MLENVNIKIWVNSTSFFVESFAHNKRPNYKIILQIKKVQEKRLEVDEMKMLRFKTVPLNSLSLARFYNTAFLNRNEKSHIQRCILCLSYNGTSWVRSSCYIVDNKANIANV
uniref:Uncharacterized protein n=1 Tax=Cacopsylla melanoneura TaxID=428564 RepID=A0A8D8V5R2_9HEMI